MASYYVGQLVQLSCEFTNTSSVATDPTTVTLYIKSPAGTTTTLTLAAADITKSATGNYYYNKTLDAAQTWEWRWVGTGTVAQADQGSFWVAEQNT